MVTEQRTSPQHVAQCLRQELQSDRTVQGLWVRDAGDRIEIWLLTEPISREQELHLYGIEMTLYEKFPDARPELHVIHKGLYESPNFVFEAPEGAEHIPLP